MIELGSEVKDLITGFKGIVAGRREFLFEDGDLWVLPHELNEDGTMKDGYWLPERRLEQI